MFTGLITGIGTVASVTHGAMTRFRIDSDWPIEPIAIGASIAHNGCCLTVTEKHATGWSVEASAETLDKTTLGAWATGHRVNLEGSLRLGDELGGHLVSGHIDGTAVLTAVVPDGDSHRLTFQAPEPLARFIAPKGSVALDGVSLTVNEVEGAQFGVNIIPHTWTVTTLGHLAPGDRVNLEIDMLARYVARLADMQPRTS